MWKALNGMHRRMVQSNWSVEQKRQRLAAEEEREVTARSFSAYGRPLEMVTSLKFLVWEISVADNDWQAVVKNLSQSRNILRRMSRILIREGAAPRVSGLFFKAVLQAVLLFGSETWVVTPARARPWGGFRPRWRYR